VRAGRDEEFRAFVLARREHLVRTALLLTAGDRHLAEDLTQSTLTSLYVHWSAYRGAGNQAAYARRCLVNALIDEKRRPWRRREQPTARITDDQARAAGPAAADPRVEALYEALRELPPRMRAVLVFRYFHDLSVADTAEALSCSQGTVKSQGARALDKMRDLLGGPEPPPDGYSGLARPQGGTPFVVHY
jgi:RNA polymerase sigma-70 factor (sigma-E family)